MEIFTPTTIINKMMNVIDKDTPGWSNLEKLRDNMGYTAPEIKDVRFWGDNYMLKKNIIDICKLYFDENQNISDIFNEAVEQYNKTGFIYKKTS
jgi:hypothetical protein